MKQAYGGLFMLMLFMIILTVVVAFASIGLVVGKGYRAKNQIVTYIEEYQGCEKETEYYTNSETFKNGCKLRGDNNNLIDNYLESIGYNSDMYTVTATRAKIASCTNCYYYEVVLNVGWSLPFINSNNTSITGSKASNGTSGTFTIKGKTDLIRE